MKFKRKSDAHDYLIGQGYMCIGKEQYMNQQECRTIHRLNRGWWYISRAQIPSKGKK